MLMKLNTMQDLAVHQVEHYFRQKEANLIVW